MVIRIDSLNKNYRSGQDLVPVLSNVCFRVEQGEYVAIMGTSGSGKSTLLNILGLLDDYDSGSYQLDGHDTRALAEPTAARLRNQMIGFVFQSFHLLAHKTLWENVALPLVYAGVPRSQRRRRSRELLGRLGLESRADQLPHQLSGGQQQRVAVARALIADPAVVLADEPTGNLDTETTHEVLALFKEIHSQGRTIVMVTHQLEVAQAAQRIVHVRDGTVVGNVVSRPQPLRRSC
jgi:putative ABC transport system ATP-binding protein